MKFLFFSSKVNNNEDYKKVIKLRMKVQIILFAIGISTLIVALLAKNIWTVKISDHMLGVYTGVGGGIMGASIAQWIKNKLILADDKKLKRSRLNNTDERIQEISKKSFRAAAIVLLISLYVTGLIGGLFYPVLVEALFGMVCIFLIIYLVAYKVYDRSM